MKKKVSFATPTSSDSTTDVKVQCWLCDGPHSFRQCKELVRIRGVCTQRPQVRKHFRNLLLQKNHGNELKVLLDAPELFDDPTADDSSSDPATIDVTDATTDHDDHVNSLQLINSDLFTTFHDGARSSNINSPYGLDFAQGYRSTFFKISLARKHNTLNTHFNKINFSPSILYQQH